MSIVLTSARQSLAAGSPSSAICQIQISRINPDGKEFVGSNHVIKVPTTPVPESFSRSNVDTVSVWQGKNVEVPPGSNVYSGGFRICNVVMFRNSKSGRLVFYHYWEAEDFHFITLDQILHSFDAESLEVVTFGNQMSSSLRAIEIHLRRRVKKLKMYEIRELSRWQFTYNQKTDQILYHGTDSKSMVVIDHIFGKEAAAQSDQRRPEYDVQLRIQNIQNEERRISFKLSYIVEEMPVPKGLEDLPETEKELRILWLSKNQELLSALPPDSDKIPEVKEKILWQKKTLKRKFGI